MTPTQSAELTGVILAAGRGSRMNSLPTRLPKPLLPVLNESIIHRQLRLMAEVNIKKAIIVVGHLGFEIAKHVERLPGLGIDVDYVLQERTLGIAHSVGELESRLQGPFLLFLGDIFLKGPRVNEMVDERGNSGADAVIGTIDERDPIALSKNFCVVTDDSGDVVRVIEKPHSPPSTTKGIGVYLFAPPVFDAVRRTPRTAMRDEYELTDTIQIMIDDGRRVRPCDCTDKDVNITVPEDLLSVNLDALRDSGMENLVDEGATIAKDASLDGVVVGAGATIGSGASLRDVLVFPGGEVAAGTSLDTAIVTDTGVHQLNRSSK